jgi:glycosyltransferase involved in cell wall biosynthesis
MTFGDPGSRATADVTLVALNVDNLSGVPRYTRALASAVDAVSSDFPDLRIRVITSVPGAAKLRIRNLDVSTVPLRRAAPGGASRLALEQIAALTARAGLLHFFDVMGPLLRPRRPFVATFHDASIVHATVARFGRARRPYKRAVYRMMLPRATRLVAVSEFARQEAVNQFGVDPSKVAVIRSGPGLTEELGATTAARDATDPGSARFLLFVGNLTTSKNLPFLIDAYDRANVDADLLLAGSRGAGHEDVVAAIRRSPFQGRIRLVESPSDRDVDRLYKTARALVMPSRYEGFGFTPLEAMSRGCPVLASDIPAHRETAGAGAALLELDPEPWAQAMRRVVNDDDYAEELRARGRAAVGAFSWEQTGRELCGLFRECLGGEQT